MVSRCNEWKKLHCFNSVSNPTLPSISDNLLAGKMAHAGPEVYSVVTRKWLLMVLESICPSRVGSFLSSS